MSTPHPPGVPCDGWPPMSQASSTPDPAPWAAVPACSLPPAPGAPSSHNPSTCAASQPQAGPTASGPSSSSAGGSNSSSRQRGTVLVVDDMAINRVVLGHMVRKAGLDVVEATNGQEAIEQVATHPPGHFQCILMDLQMPVVDGWQATQQIRAWEAGYARANSEATLPGPGVGSPPGAPYRMQTYMTDDMGGGVMSHALLSRSTTYMTDELGPGDGRLGTCAAPSRSSTCVRDEAGCQAGRGFGRSGTCMTDELQQWGSMGTPGQLPSSGALGQGSEDVLDIRGRSGPSAGGGSSGSSMHALLPPLGGVLPAAAQVAMPIAAAVRAAGARSSHFPALEQLAAAAAAEAAVAVEPVAAGSSANPGSQDLARHQPAPAAAAAQQLPLGIGVTHFVQQRQQQREQQAVWYGVRHEVLPMQQLLLPLGALRLSAGGDAGAAAVPASAAAVVPATDPAGSLDLGPWRQQVLQAPPGMQRPTRPAPGLGPLSEASNSGSGSSSSTSGHSRHAPLLPGATTTPAHHVLAAGRSSRSGLQPGELAEELGFLDDGCEPFLLRGCNACNLSREPVGAPAADHDHDDDDGTLSDSFSERSGASTPRGMAFPGMHDAGLAATLSLLGSGLLEPDNAAYARAASRLPVQEVESEDDDAAPGAALGAGVDGGASQPQSGQLPLVHDGDNVAAVGHEEEAAADDDQPQVEGAQIATGPAGPTAAGSGVQHGQLPHSNPFRASSPSLLLQPPTPGSEAGPAPAAAPPAQLARERLLALMVEAPGPLERPDGAFSFARMHSTPWSGFGALATPPSSAIQLRLGTTCPLGVGPSHATSHHTTSSWGRSHSAVLSGAGPAAVRVPIVACTAEVLGGPPVNCPSFVETTPPSSPPMTAAQHALSCGVDECVRKPLSFQELCGLLSKYIPAWAEDHADMAPAAGAAAAEASSAGPSRSTAMRPADVRQRPPLLRRQHLQVLPEVQAALEAEGPGGQPAKPPGAASQQQH